MVYFNNFTPMVGFVQNCNILNHKKYIIFLKTSFTILYFAVVRSFAYFFLASNWNILDVTFVCNHWWIHFHPWPAETWCHLFPFYLYWCNSKLICAYFTCVFQCHFIQWHQLVSVAKCLLFASLRILICAKSYYLVHLCVPVYWLNWIVPNWLLFFIWLFA